MLGEDFNMPFFPNYPNALYLFGNETDPVEFPNLVAYSEILDKVKNNSSFYQKYTIQNPERPDSVSYRFYRNPNYHWTFFYLNDNLRESGWPLTNAQFDEKIADDFPNTVIETRNDIFNSFLVGQTVTGVESGKTGTIIKRDLNIGHIFIEGSIDFVSGEGFVSSADQSISSVATYEQKDAPLYYVDGDGKIISIDPFTGPGSNNSVTYSEYYRKRNEELKDIIVMKPDVMNQFISEFTRTMRIV